MTPSSDACPACGQSAMVAYCSQCGEKRREPSDWKLSNIAGEAFAEITDIEHSKLWQTLRLLVFKPGQLTRDDWHGRRKPFLGPVKLYLTFFALSLLLYTIHQPSAVYDVRTLAAANPGGKLSRLIETQAAERVITTEQFAQEVNARWQRYISLSQLVYPFFVALALKLLFLRRTIYFTQHLVFALHLLAFTFLSVSLLWPFYSALGITPSFDQFRPTYILLTTASFVWMVAYLFLALRRTYEERWPRAALKAGFVFFTYVATSAVFSSLTIALAIARSRRGG